MKNTLLLLAFVFVSCKTTQILPDPLEAGWEGEKVCEVLSDTKKQRVLKCTFPPNVGHQKHYHKPHFGYTIAGSTFQITDNKGIRNVPVATGVNWYKAELSEHEVFNVGDSTAVFLIIEPK
ncbi:cupin domain-containing protein [Lacinutrix sp.]|uniref:cupin domain-containing protein n=1 Tax=Lacinutrix sp. TaxID=1937692 RepID=UPI0026070474|nr:cupin domain-containing protein [Lacinutrix sp.]MDG1715234.1 cupin domain-containing protein [Lacinutrix sp.]